MEKMLGALFLLVLFVYLAIKSRTSKHRRGMTGSRTAKGWRRGYVGAPGEQIHIAVTYVDRKRFESNGRVGYRYRFRDGQGHCLVWFTSYATLDEGGKAIQPGASLEIGATVSKHKNYHGAHETVVERVRVEPLAIGNAVANTD